MTYMAGTGAGELPVIWPRAKQPQGYRDKPPLAPMYVEPRAQGGPERSSTGRPVV
jgi:hypothetical protein